MDPVWDRIGEIHLRVEEFGSRLEEVDWEDLDEVVKTFCQHKQLIRLLLSLCNE